MTLTRRRPRAPKDWGSRCAGASTLRHRVSAVLTFFVIAGCSGSLDTAQAKTQIDTWLHDPAHTLMIRCVPGLNVYGSPQDKKDWQGQSSPTSSVGYLPQAANLLGEVQNAGLGSFKGDAPDPNGGVDSQGFFLNSAGKELYEEGQLCFARGIAVASIVSMTSPGTDANGQTRSQVIFTYKLVDLQKWSSSAAASAYMMTGQHPIKDAVDGQDKTQWQASLVKTDHGWQVSDVQVPPS